MDDEALLKRYFEQLSCKTCQSELNHEKLSIYHGDDGSVFGTTPCAQCGASMMISLIHLKPIPKGKKPSAPKKKEQREPKRKSKSPYSWEVNESERRRFKKLGAIEDSEREGFGKYLSEVTNDDLWQDIRRFR